MGLARIRAQHVGRSDYRLSCDVCCGRAVSPREQVSRAREDFPAGRCDCGMHFMYCADFSHRRLAGPIHGEASARRSGGHGRTGQVAAGWMTAEIGRQPWVVYGLMRTSQGYSKYVSAGNGLFTLLGFMGMYTVLSILFIVLVYRIIDKGPELPVGTQAPKNSALATA